MNSFIPVHAKKVMETILRVLLTFDNNWPLQSPISFFDEKMKIKIPLAPFKKGEPAPPFREGGWGDLNLSPVLQSAPF